MKGRDLKFIKTLPFIAIGLVVLLGGILLGMQLQQMMIVAGLVQFGEALEGTSIEVNVDINETLIVDRTMDRMNEFGVFNLTNNSKEIET